MSQLFSLAANLAMLEGKATLERIAAKKSSLEKIAAAPTNDDRMAWMVKHLTYLEHTDKNGITAHKSPRGGWWPQTEDDDPEVSLEEFIGIGLVEYIDAQIIGARK